MSVARHPTLARRRDRWPGLCPAGASYVIASGVPADPVAPRTGIGANT